MSAKEWLRRIELGAGIITVAAVCLLAPSSAAATPVFNVTTPTDAVKGAIVGGKTVDCTNSSDACTLRDAIHEANAADSDVTINLPAGTYKLTIAPTGTDDENSGDLNVTDASGTVTINGAGATSTAIDGNFTDRIFDVSSGSKLAVSGVTIQNGRTGGLSSSTSCPAATLPATEADGGAILQSGDLTLSGDVITGNLAAGDGGGIEFNGSGTLSISQTTVSSNRACPWQGADSLSGGGIDEDGGGTVTIDSSTITGNAADPGPNSVTTDGGGVAEVSNLELGKFGAVSISSSTVSGNSATLGGGVFAGDVDFFFIVILDSGKSANESTAASGGVSGQPIIPIIPIPILPFGFGSVGLSADTLVGNTAAEAGGGVENFGDLVGMVNATITANRAIGGGGVDDFCSPTEILYSTVNANTASDGPGNLSAQCLAAAAKNDSAGPQNFLAEELFPGIGLDDSIVTAGVGPGSTPSNCGPSKTLFMDNGHNLFDDDGSACGGPASGDVTNSNPKLGPLQDNGGPTQTEALLFGSPAIDAADDSACANTRNANNQLVDERGVTRPQGSHCDIGAYEYGGADEVLSVTPQSSTIHVGDQEKLTDTVTNSGPTFATGVTFTDPAPLGLRFDSVSSSQGTCTNTASSVTCKLGAIAKGASVSITIKVTGVGTGQQSVTSHVGADEPDPTPHDNTATATINVVSPASKATADLSLRKAVSPKSVHVGDELTYKISARNHGPSTATHVKLVDKLPASVKLASTKTSKGHCSGTQTVICKVSKLRSGRHFTVTIVVRTLSAGTVTNTAGVHAREPDPRHGNNHARATAQVAANGCVRTIHAHTLRLQPGPFTALVYVDGKLILTFHGSQLPLGEIRQRAHHGVVQVLIIQGGTKNVFELDFSRCQRANIALE